MHQPHYSISDLTREFDITARTLRYYEAEGLIAPHRQGQTRLYSETDRVKLAWILRGKRVGFSLAEIGEIMHLYRQADGAERQLQSALNLCKDRIADLEAQRADIDATLADLQEFRSHAERLEFNKHTGEWIDAETGQRPAMVAPFLEPPKPRAAE